jgi:HKD family nuclease
MGKDMTGYKNLFLTNYTEQTFLARIREDLRTCEEFMFSVSFIKKAGLVLLIQKCQYIQNL